MDIRLLPKLLLWAMLIVACLGTFSSLLRPPADPATTFAKESTEQQMAIHAALGFAREWMDWNGEELTEARLNRLRPYVDPKAMGSVAPVQTEQKTKRQEVIAAELVSISSSGASRYTVRVRVIVKNPDRVTWEADVQVWAKAGKGVAVSTPPLIRPLQEPPAFPESESGEPTASGEVNSLDRLDATGVGPYSVTVTFSAKDEATSFRLTQVWKLTVREENQKFFVGAVE